MHKIAAWNVNSIKMRLTHVLDWLETSGCDTLMLQEIKTVEENFPFEALQNKGYQVEAFGQKTYNGVAIISRYPIQDVCRGMPDYVDPQSRVLSASVQGVRVVNVYIPNGAALDSDKFLYKMQWLEALQAFLRAQIDQYPELVLGGDFNIAPKDIDVHDPAEWEGKVHVSAQERQAFETICALGLSDSFRSLHPEEVAYSWWDYRAAAFRRNRGLRIDHLLVTEALKEKLESAGIDKAPRKLEKPSDHTPVWLQVC